MMNLRQNRGLLDGVGWLGLTILILAPFAVMAQQSDDDDESVEEIEEIIVYGGQRRGDKVDLDALYEEELKARLMRDLEWLEEQDAKGRWSQTTTEPAQTSARMSWGYDPESESRMRRETDLMGPQRDTVQPASVFRVEF